MIGTFGKISFEVSSNRVFTPNEEEITAGSKSTMKESASSKPVTTKSTPELRTYKFKVTVSTALGVDVQSTMDTLLQMAEDGKAEHMNMGGKPVAKNKLQLNKASVSDIVRNGKGVPVSAEISLDFQEYITGKQAKKTANGRSGNQNGKNGKNGKKGKNKFSDSFYRSYWIRRGYTNWDTIFESTRQLLRDDYDKNKMYKATEASYRAYYSTQGVIWDSMPEAAKESYRKRYDAKFGTYH